MQIRSKRVLDVNHLPPVSDHEWWTFHTELRYGDLLYSLSNWKEGEITRAGRERLVFLIRGLLKMKSALARHKSAAKRNARVEVDEETYELWSTLHATLAEYPSVESLTFCKDGSYMLTPTNIGNRSNREFELAHRVIEIAKKGTLHLLRECLCGEWFVAARRDQKSCSAACRHKLYERTEAFKQRRREYMRKYYRLKTSGKVK